jgi:hypothetical protein
MHNWKEAFGKYVYDESFYCCSLFKGTRLRVQKSDDLRENISVICI